MTKTLTGPARDALAAATINDSHVTLPHQLDRGTYEEVNKALMILGGKWNRKAGAHVFTTSPADELATVVDTGLMPVDRDKLASYWPTPPAIATHLATEAHVGNLPAGTRVLEPSAGTGAIVTAILTENPGVNVTAIEVDGGRAATLRGMRCSTYEGRFQDWAVLCDDRFPAIVMNPPFTEPGDAQAWATHTVAAFTLLTPGGRLAAVVPRSIEASTRKAATAVRVLVEEHGAMWRLPDDAFAASGTLVRTNVITLQAPR